MIVEQQIAAVDPLRLAVQSGMNAPRRFAAPLPPVIRPHLLTQQLRGLCCDSCDGGMATPPDYGRLAGLRGGMYIFPDSGLSGLRQYIESTSEGLGFTPGFTLPSPDEFDPGALQVPSIGSGNMSLLQAVTMGANFVPGVGQVASVAIQSAAQFIARFEQWFHVGAGRHEADIIVPVQNDMMTALGPITDQILVGRNPDAHQLAALYREVWARAVSFQEFVLMKNFTDRRASGQALNTVMPYIDGSCGYQEPVGPTATPSRFNCLSWGDGTLGGIGTNGMLGAIARAIESVGGSVPSLPDLHQAANQGIPITNPGSVPGGGVPGVTPGAGGSLFMGVSTPLALMIGVAALFFWKRGLL
jgi:hypothetical protein